MSDGRDSMKSGGAPNPLNDDSAGSDEGAASGDELTQEPAQNRAVDADTDEVEHSPVDEPEITQSIPFEGQALPLLMTRDRVKPSRDGGTLQVRMYKETEDRVTAATHAVRGSFDESTHVNKMDINEALVVAGLLNLDDVHKTLKTWGYDFDTEKLQDQLNQG